MKTIKKITTLFFIIITSIFSLSGCNDINTNSIEDLAYVIAIGIDKGENNLLKLSLQFATPSSSNPTESSNSGSQSSLSSVECASIDSGINLINSYISKKINLAHCKVVVFSEIIAEEGISDEIYTLVNNVQIRPDCSLIISRCDANDFLKNSKPVLVNLVERYYEVIVNSGEYTGYFADIKLIDFYSALKEPSIQPIAMLGGINADETHLKKNNSNYIDKDSSYKAGEAPINDKNNLEIMGMAVFKDDKLVGELNGIDTISHLLVTGLLKNCIINIPDPFKENNLICLSIRNPKKAKNTVKFVNNTPYITSNIYLEATILTLDEGSDYTNGNNLKIISSYTDSYIKNNVTEYLYRTSNELKSDIVGFGRKSLSKFSNFREWNDKNWLENYKNAIFDVNVSTLVKTSTIILKN